MNQIKSRRLAAGVTQRELADAAGINIRQLQKIEAGEISLCNLSAKNLIALSDALKIDPHDLLDCKVF